MSYALFHNDQKISGPFAEKSEAWAEAMRRGLVKVIPSFDEDPPRRMLDLNYSIGPVDRRKVASSYPRHTNSIAPSGDSSIQSV